VSQSPEWVTVDDVIAINESIVAVTGEPHYIVNRNGLESAVDRPRKHFEWADDGTADDLVLLGSKLCIGISQSQAFGQGNKRTGFVAMQMFFRQNGFNIGTEGHNRIADLILGAANPDRDRRISDEGFAEGLDPFVVDLDHAIITVGGMMGAMADLAGFSMALKKSGDHGVEAATNAMNMNLGSTPSSNRTTISIITNAKERKGG